MRVRDDAALPQRERLERLYEGDVFRDEPTAGTAALVEYVWSRVASSFPEGDPVAVHEWLPNAVFFQRVTALRHALLAEPSIKPLIHDTLASFGWDLDRTYFDLLRLRAVPSGGYRVAEAREAYVVHRDIWYANPPAQVNVWIALREVPEEEAFGFRPDHWERAIANSSDRFDYGSWNVLGGWQVPNDRKHYPTADEPPGGPLVRLAVPAAGSLKFSGTHLHGTVGHDSGRTRFSVEIRTVHVDDVLRVQPLRNLDNRSTGTTLFDYFRASDFAPFPRDVAREHEAWSASRR